MPPLTLDEDEQVTIPPSGKRTIFVDTDGTTKQLLSDGTTEAVGGTALTSANAGTGIEIDDSVPAVPVINAVSVGWDAIQWARIKLLLNDEVDNYMWSDLLNPNEYDITVGTAPGAQLAASTGGVVRLSGGAGSGYVQFAGMKQGAPVIKPVPNQKTSSWAAAFRFRIPNAVVASQFTELAFYASGNGSGTMLRLDQTVSATVFHLLQDRSPDAGGTTDTACSGVMTIGDGITIGTWYDALIAWNANTEVLTAQIDGVTCATSSVSTNQPTEDGTSVLVDTNKANSIDAIMLAFKREL